jgi:hypothetical protein
VSPSRASIAIVAVRSIPHRASAAGLFIAAKAKDFRLAGKTGTRAASPASMAR